MEVTRVLAHNFKKANRLNRYLWHCKMTESSDWSTSAISYQCGPELISPRSKIEYQFAQYRILLVLDFAPSIFSYHLQTNTCISDRIIPAIEDIIVQLHNTKADIELSVVLARIGGSPIKTIVQSYRLNKFSSPESLIEIVKAEILHKHLFVPNVLQKPFDSKIYVDFVSIIKWCFFLLSLMNFEALPIVIYLTDAVNCQIESGIYDGLIMQYCRADISFNVVSLSEGMDSNYIQFGYLPEPSSLKMFVKITEGHYLSIEELWKIPEVLTRSTQLFRELPNPEITANFLDEYDLNLPLKYILECRLREGFMISCFSSERTSLLLIFHFRCFIDYSIYPQEQGFHVIIRILCRPELFLKISRKYESSNNISKGTQPSVASKLAFVVQIMRESENTAMLIYHSLQIMNTIEITNKMVKLKLSRWHRWFEVERLDIILKVNSKDVIRDKIKQLGNSRCIERDCFLMTSSHKLLIVKLVWECKNLATVYFGMFGFTADEVTQKFTECFQKLSDSCLYRVINRPISIVLVESLKEKKYTSKVYSIFNYRPIDQVIKASMFVKKKARECISEDSAENMLRTFFRLKLSQDFIYLGETQNGNWLLLKPIYFENDMQDRGICFIQNLLYRQGNSVFSEIYLEPSVASILNKGEKETIKEVTCNLEIYDKFIFRSIMTFDYLMLNSLQKKLGDEDAQEEPESDDDSEEKVVEFQEEDDLYCYFYPEVHPNDYEKLKLAVYESMFEVYQNYVGGEFDTYIFELLKNSSKSLLPLDIYSLSDSRSVESWDKTLGILYKNMHTGFSAISDYYVIKDASHFFVRYIAKDILLIWTIPTCFDFIEVCMKTKSYFYLQIYECSAAYIHPNNIFAEPKASQSSSLPETARMTIRKTVSLIEHVFKSVHNTTCYECLRIKNLQFSKTTLVTLLNSCQAISEKIEVPKLNTSELPRVPALIYNSIVLNDECFRHLDDQLKAYLNKYFVEVHKGIFISKHSREKLFFTIEDGFTKLSSVIYYSSLNVKIFMFNNKSFFGNKLNSNRTVENLKEEAILKKVSRKIESLLAEFIVEYLKFSLELTPDLFKIVLKYLLKIKKTEKIEYTMEFIIPQNSFSEIIEEELKKTKELNLMSIDKYFYCISSKFKNFYLKEDLENSSSLASKEENPNSHKIPFWVIISIDSRTIKAYFYISKRLEHDQLTPEIVRNNLIKTFENTEKRINKKLLLNQLLETGKLSSLLIPLPTNNEKPVLGKEKRTRNSKGRPMSKDVTESTHSPYNLEIQHVNYFKKNDRLTNDQVLNELRNNFTFPSFIIQNRDGMFMQKHDSEVYIFTINLEKNTEKDIHMIKFEIYGIDKPNEETIQQLEMIIQEKLEQISLMILADSLFKSQKQTITPNDVEFIQSSKEPEYLYYHIIEIISDPHFVLYCIKQNLSRFLTQVYCKEESILLYNYMKVFENTLTKKKNQPPLRFLQPDTNYLGSKFGKALALIYVNILHFDGIDLQPPVAKPSRLDFSDTEYCTLGSIHKTPSVPGNYLQIKIYKNGRLNASAFINDLEKSIRQCITEVLIETHLQSPIPKNSFYFFSQILKHSKYLINTSLNRLNSPILHYSSFYSLFDFFKVCLKITRIILEGKNIKSQYCIEEKTDCIILSQSLKDLKLIWDAEYSRDRCVGRDLKLSAIFGLQTEVTDNIKLYPTSKRSVFLSIEVYPTFIEIYSYNLNRTLSDKIYEKIEKHVHWSFERYKMLNKALTQKLGLHFHSTNLKTNSSRVILGESQHEQWPRGCNRFDLKQESMQFKFNSLISSKESEHTPGRSDEMLENYKTQGLYPQAKNYIDFVISDDKVKQHGKLLYDLLDHKKELYEHCVNLAFIIKTWFSQCSSNLNYIASKILQTASGLRRSEVYTIRTLSKRASLLYYDKAHLFIIQSGNFESDFVDTENDKKKIKLVQSHIIRSYAQDIKKATKMELLYSEDHSHSTRKMSQDIILDGLKNLRAGRSTGGIEKDTSEVLQIYLRRVFDQTMIILEISIVETQFSVSAYAFESLEQKLQVNQVEDAQISNNSRKEIFRVLNYLKVVNFTYETQVMHMAFYLYRSLDYPNIDLIQSLINFSNTFKKAPSGCHNWVYSGQLIVDLGDLHGVSVDEIYHYFTMNCEEYGFKKLNSRSQPAVYTVSSQDYDLEAHTNNLTRKRLSSIDGKNSAFLSDLKDIPTLRGTVYTRIDFSEKGRLPIPMNLGKESNNKLRIKYFIIFYVKIKRPGAQERLNMIKKNTNDFIVEALRKSIEHNKRDRLWERLTDYTNPDDYSVRDFSELLAASNVHNIEGIDPRITHLTLLKGVFSKECFDFLETTYGDNCKRFNREEIIELVVFKNPRMFGHLVIDTDEGVLKINCVKRSPKYHIYEEDEFITDLVNKILHWLWVRLTDD